VPLVLYYPKRVAAGRETRPVMNFDLFPTVLELTGVPPPPGLHSQAVSLLEPQPLRRRYAETGSSSDVGIAQVKRAHPEFDPSRFERSLRALVVDSKKFLWGSDGRHALYDLAADPLETHDLLPTEPALGSRLAGELDGYWRSLDHCDAAALPDRLGGLSRSQRRRLEALGYLDEHADAPNEANEPNER
jgi:arylsulfatase A-like enzyme